MWIVDYFDYKPGRQDGSVFDPPSACDGKKIKPSEGLRSFPGQMMALAPSVHPCELLVLTFVLSHALLVFEAASLAMQSDLHLETEQ